MEKIALDTEDLCGIAVSAIERGCVFGWDDSADTIYDKAFNVAAVALRQCGVAESIVTWVAGEVARNYAQP